LTLQTGTIFAKTSTEICEITTQNHAKIKFKKGLHAIDFWGIAVISAKNRKRQRRKRQYVTAKREKSQTPKVLPAILTSPNLTYTNFGVRGFSRLAVTDWLLRRWRLWFLAQPNAPRLLKLEQILDSAEDT